MLYEIHRHYRCLFENLTRNCRCNTAGSEKSKMEDRLYYNVSGFRMPPFEGGHFRLKLSSSMLFNDRYIAEIKQCHNIDILCQLLLWLKKQCVKPSISLILLEKWHQLRAQYARKTVLSTNISDLAWKMSPIENGHNRQFLKKVANKLFLTINISDIAWKIAPIEKGHNRHQFYGNWC